LASGFTELVPEWFLAITGKKNGERGKSGKLEKVKSYKVEKLVNSVK